MNKIIIEIHDPHTKTEAKFKATVEALSKALKVQAQISHDHDHSKAEPTPYPSLLGLSEDVASSGASGLRRVFESIITQWFRLDVQKSTTYFKEFCKGVNDPTNDDPFELNGMTYINPQTGRSLTKGEWELIARDLDDVFGYLYSDAQQSLTLRALALGKVLQGMPVHDQTTMTYGAVLPAVNAVADQVSSDDVYRNAIDFADVHCGELIQDITSSSRRAVVATIIDAQKNRLTPRETEAKLFETFATLNRDWRRIAETETATNFNTGYLMAETEKRKPDEPIFMRGVSGAGACGFCRSHVNKQVVVLLDTAPDGLDDTVTIDGKQYTAIWPGKNNFGRKASNWWVSAGTQHPHCRCTWVRFKPDMQKYYDMLDEAMRRNT